MRTGLLTGTQPVDLSGYGLESVLGLYFNPSPLLLPETAADFTFASFHPQHLLTHGGVAIYAGDGKPMPSLQADIPHVSSIQRVTYFIRLAHISKAGSRVTPRTFESHQRLSRSAVAHTQTDACTLIASGQG